MPENRPSMASPEYMNISLVMTAIEFSQLIVYSTTGTTYYS